MKTLLALIVVLSVTGCAVTERTYSPGSSGYVYSVDYKHPYWSNNSYNSEYIYNSSNYFGNPDYIQGQDDTRWNI